MLVRKTALSVALLFGAMFASLGSSAAPNEATRVEAGVEAAQALFDRGRALVKQGRAAEACPLFEKSQELDPGLGTQFNLADCYERLGRLASAHRLYTRVAERAHATAQDRRASVARERAAAVVPRLSKIVIHVPASDTELRIERDGAELPPGEWNIPVPVDPGIHRVRAWGPGLGNWSTEVNVTSEGSWHEVTVPASEEPAFFEPLHRKLGLAAAGVGLVGVSVGTYFGIRAIAKKSQANDLGCDGSRCSTPESARIRNQARSAGDGATLAMSIGAVGLATAGVLLWIVPEAEPERPERDRRGRVGLQPTLVTRGAGLSVHGEF